MRIMVAVALAEPPLVKIGFRNEDGEVETLWAFDLGGGRYRLDNTPWFQYGVSTKDIVEAAPDDGMPFFQRVLEKSGYRTVRVLLDEPATEQFLAQIRNLGCSYEGATPKFLGIDIPPAVELSCVTAFLIGEGVQWEYADPTYEDVHGQAT